MPVGLGEVVAVELAEVFQYSAVRTVDFHELDRLGRRARRPLRRAGGPW
jgi:hypothetical protein